MPNIFDAQVIFFTVPFFNYPMSYLEFFGTVFNLWCVWLAVKNNRLTWIVGNIGVVFFLVLFYQIQLYSDFVENIYFLGSGFYGMWVWYFTSKDKRDSKKEIPITVNTTGMNLIYLTIIIVGTTGLTVFMSNIHLIFPQWFPIPASLPFWDALTTTMSFVGQWLLAKKKLECWYLWIAVDVLDLYIYSYKEVYLITFLYAVFLVLAIKGLVDWKKEMKKNESISS